MTWVKPRSYGLRITVSEEDGETLAQIDLANVFIDPGTLRPVTQMSGSWQRSGSACWTARS